MAAKSTNKYVKQTDSKIMKWLLQYSLVGVAVHWTFQGMLYMDGTERRFKLLTDALLTVLGALLLRRRLPTRFAYSLAFLIAHSLNFLFNGQLWVVLKHYGYVSHSYQAFEKYTNQIAERIKSEPSIEYAALYGSRVRNEWHPASDLDLRVIRRASWGNGLKSCLFVLRERSRALLVGFPLDIYVLDSEIPLRKLRKDENQLVIKR